MTKAITISLLIVSIIISGCASMLNSDYQKITINKSEADQILINGKAPQMKKGKYLIERDLKPKQITISSEGYKDVNKVVIQRKSSPMYIISYVPFGIFFFIPPLVDMFSEKSWNYVADDIKYNKTKQLPVQSANAKHIQMKKVSVELISQNIKYRYFFTYKEYIKNLDEAPLLGSEYKSSIVIENTVFSKTLNELLVEKGYIDTSRIALKGSYMDNLYVAAAIKDITLHHIKSNYSELYGGMVYVDLSVQWDALDFYEKSVYTMTTNLRSGEFAIFNYKDKDEVIEKVVKDAMETGLIQFMATHEVDSLLHDKSDIELEKNMALLTIPAAKKYATEISQGVNSTLTIKSKDGFGSGFIISENGYIITSYHVIADTAGLKAILNDNSEYSVEVIRVSKIYDLALLKINATGFQPYELNLSKNIPIASEIYAVGTPTAEDLAQTISRGIISGFRNVNDTRMIQTDASVNSGNSGGPLVDKNGKVIGVVASKLKGAGIEGVAFGVPSYEICDRLKIEIK